MNEVHIRLPLPITVREVEKQLTLAALSYNQCCVKHAAKMLGVSRTCLYAMMKRHGVKITKEQGEWVVRVAPAGTSVPGGTVPPAQG